MSAINDTTTIRSDHPDMPDIVLQGTGYATRCAAHVAAENGPDGRWCLEVLNRYGHLVPHEADMRRDTTC